MLTERDKMFKTEEKNINEQAAVCVENAAEKLRSGEMYVEEIKYRNGEISRIVFGKENYINTPL